MQTTSNGIKWAYLAPPLALALGTALALPLLWQVVADAGHVARSGARLGPDEVLTALAAAAALSGLAWLALSFVLELLALGPGAVGRSARRVADAVTPALLRRLVGGALGVGLVAGLAPGAAVASVASVPSSRPVVTPGLPSPGGGVTDEAVAAPFSLPDPALAPPPPLRGWVPAPPVVRAQPDVRVLTPAPRPAARPEAPTEVVVHRGDTLWSVAARHLGPAATDAEIADAWPRWFAANRSVIGDDPDVLHPGQRLRPPDEVRS